MRKKCVRPPLSVLSEKCRARDAVPAQCKGVNGLECGISTACFYPQETAAALRTVCAMGVGTTEIFLNTFSELEPAYVDRLRETACSTHTRICSLHPFTSALETFFFASAYQGRVEDGVRLYRRYFEVCQMLGIPRVVFHGDFLQTPYPFERHCANYLLLRRVARSYGVEFCQENVVRCKCGRPEYLRRMREYTGDDVSFVLDVKQQRRADVPLQEIMDAMQGKISHVHLSGAAPENDCVTPDETNFPLREFLRSLVRGGFAGDMVIELYRSGFSTQEELRAAAARVDAVYAEILTEQKQRREEKA